MKPSILAAGAAAVLLRGVAIAAPDHMAGMSLAPSDAAGPWTLENNGRSLCVLTLGSEKVGAGYRVSAGESCQGDLPATPAAWEPTDHGMKLVGADGQTVMTFNRWSDSLLVSSLHGETSLQLRRGR
jgi:Protease inhibitor Inh